VNPAEAVYTVAVIKEGTGFLWEGEVSAELEVREVSEPATGTPVVAWYGYVASVPEGGQFDDCLVLSPEEARRAVGIEGVDEEVEAEIVALRGQEEPGKYAHFWGTLVCDVLDYAGCQVRVAKLRLEGPGPFFGPDPVDGWEGTIVSGPAGPRSGGDDYLIVIVDGIPIEYGIDSQDEAVAATIDSLRDSGAVVRVWGELSAGVIDWNGTQILVERLETVLAGPAGLAGYEGWGTYTNEAFGYTLRYPAESTVLEASQNSGVQISGPLVDNERWPLIEVSYFHSEFYQPPVDVDLQEWVLEHVPSYDAVDTQTQVAGRPAVHLAHEASPQAYAFDEYYFVEGGQLFRVGIIHTGGQEDWELYDKFLSGVSFLDAQ
jgi:hypothetical protein